MVPSDAKIRFVGGPWHNRLVEVKLLCHIDVIEAELPKLSFFKSLTDLLAYKPTNCKRSTYFLKTFRTDRGTGFLQYVHESLIEKGNAARCTYAEQLPKQLPIELSDDFMKRLILILWNDKLRRNALQPPVLAPE